MYLCLQFYTVWSEPAVDLIIIKSVHKYNETALRYLPN